MDTAERLSREVQRLCTVRTNDMIRRAFSIHSLSLSLSDSQHSAHSQHTNRLLKMTAARLALALSFVVIVAMGASDAPVLQGLANSLARSSSASAVAGKAARKVRIAGRAATCAEILQDLLRDS